jgi:hypothetical protein
LIDLVGQANRQVAHGGDPIGVGELGGEAATARFRQLAFGDFMLQRGDHLCEFCRAVRHAKFKVVNLPANGPGGGSDDEPAQRDQQRRHGNRNRQAVDAEAAQLLGCL